MGRPSSPRAWLRWAARVLEAQARPFSPKYDHIPRGDFRLQEAREMALDVKIFLERASAACSRNGVGARLIVQYYLHEEPWASFSEREKRILKKTARAFTEKLRDEGFLSREG